MSEPYEPPNIPRTLKEVKRGFIPKYDAFMWFDYSNIELRILGYYMAIALDDWSVADEFRAGQDLHVNTAIGLFNKPRNEITDLDRQRAKVFMFSTVYGGGAPTMIRQGIAKDFVEARALLKKLHQHRPGIKLLSKALVDRLDNVGYIQTPWGSRLHPLDDHKALNVLIQGCAADLMRHGIRETSRYLRENSLYSEIVNVVHDEIMFDCYDTEIQQLSSNIPTLMGYQTINDVVPIKTSVEISYTNWADKKEYEGRYFGR